MLLPQPRVYLTGMKKKLQQEEKAKIWHKGMGLVFQDYNELLEKGMLVRCSDGNVRDIRMIFGLMIGDQPELETACCCAPACRGESEPIHSYWLLFIVYYWLLSSRIASSSSTWLL